MCEYRGMRRVCARCGEDGHMATACTNPYCKRCGVFGHDTEGCSEECKRCGGRHSTRECFRRRSYVAAARVFPPASETAPARDQSSGQASPTGSMVMSGLHVLKPRPPPSTPRKAPDYWDGDKTTENDAMSAATSSSVPRADQRACAEHSASATSDSDITAISPSDASSAKPSPNSSLAPHSSSDEQEVPTTGANIDGGESTTPLANDESNVSASHGRGRASNLDETPIVSSGRYALPPDHSYVLPATDPGPSHQAPATNRTESTASTASTSQPGLERRHRSRSRRRQGDREKTATVERAGSAENNLRRQKTGELSSDSDAARRAKTKKPRRGSLGDGTRPPSGDQKTQSTARKSGRFVNLYALVARSNTNAFYKELHELLLEPLPHVLLGDFNCVADSQRDVRGPGRGGSTYQAKELVKTLWHLNLTDTWVHLHGDHFAPTRTSKTTASRIDRTYLPDYLLPAVVSCEVLALPNDLVGKSDHLPLATTVLGSPGPRNCNISWRLDPTLLQDEDCVQRVRDRILESLGNAPQITPHAWDSLKESWKRLLQEEGRARKRRLSAQMDEILRRMRIIREAETLTSCTRDYLDSLEITYTRLLRLQTPRPTKAQDPPDDSTNLDPREVCGNGTVQITEVKRPDGTIATDPKEIAAIFRNHFLKQFQETDQTGVDSTTRQINELCQNLRRPGEEELSGLCSEATTEELHRAIRSMPPNSAPGTDGLTAGFYAVFLDTLGEALLTLVNAILEHHMKPNSFGAGRIVLLLKDGAPPNEPPSWRPITLLNVDYKIVATILNNGLKLLLPSIISPCQSCAVPGQSMFANLTATRDVFEYAAQKKLSGAFFCLDQAKAFDRVKHRYMLEVLREFGFPGDFVRLVELLYRDLSCNVVVNGSATAGFIYTRGIRQGCPLGPTFFIMCIEPLLTSLASDERIRGFPLTGADEIKVLAYADDVSLFVRDARSFREFLSAFNRYAEVSGAELNERNSRALLFGAFPKEAIGNVQTVSTVKVLGIFFSYDGVAETTWQKAVERAHLATARTRRLDLTLREKALAVKTRICAFANYTSRVAVMPAKTASQLNKMISSLLWDDKPAPVKRNLLQLPEGEGGLGLPHVTTISRVLALKTVRFLHQASDFYGKGLLLYWSSTNTKYLDADRQPGPLAEFPSPFYKTAANTKRMLDKEAACCDIDKDPPVCIAETITGNQLSADESRKTKTWRRKKGNQSRGLPREVHDFMWKKNWKVLPSKQRLHKFGIVPSARCPSCRAEESAEHALFECTAAKPVWRLVAKDFGIRLSPAHGRNRGAFARLCFPFTETWYEVYRNFEEDPYLGGTATCIRATETGPYTDGSTPATVEYSPDVSLDVTLTLVSSAGYDAKNVIAVQSLVVSSVKFNFTTVYRDCQRCKVFRHSYIDGGATSSKYSDRLCLFSEFKMSVVDVGTYEIVYDRTPLACFGACRPVGDVLLIFLFRRRLDTTVKSLSEAIPSVEEPSEVSMWTTLGPKWSLASEAQ
ncbi:hypothetical protein HPB52_002808 [Rhipicephalus sanguineus]|uniref:Reverse transcriptase n=1 Tax=Rhipicephalus sanguineus TaxID=34632 RepID=A0A9D4PTX0_RHISA|nr:hypothetical protein HPB52_002808 [Rhipicephalus sanguineus]